MLDNMKNIPAIIITASIIFILSALFINALEIEECQGWAMYPADFLPWQLAQCEAHNIDIK